MEIQGNSLVLVLYVERQKRYFPLSTPRDQPGEGNKTCYYIYTTFHNSLDFNSMSDKENGFALMNAWSVTFMGNQPVHRMPVCACPKFVICQGSGYL